MHQSSSATVETTHGASPLIDTDRPGSATAIDASSTVAPRLGRRNTRPSASVHGRSTAALLLRGLPRSTVHILRFAAIAGLTTAAYVLLYLSLRTGMSAQASNALALVVTAVANAGANRLWTFDVRGRVQTGWYRAEAVFTFGVALVLTSSYLSAAHAATAAPTRLVELVALVLAISVATLLQFVLLMRLLLSSSTAGSPMVARDRS